MIMLDRHCTIIVVSFWVTVPGYMIMLDRRCTDTVVSFRVTVPIYNDHAGQTLHLISADTVPH